MRSAGVLGVALAAGAAAWGLAPLAQAASTLPALAGPAAPPLMGHEVLDQVAGDLNGDGVADLAVVYGRKPEPSTRPLIVFWGKPGGGFANTWLRSDVVMLRSDEGGMLGDPRQELAIQNGSLVVAHSGGAGWAWTTTERYRLQAGAMRLVGLTGVEWHRGDPNGSYTKRDANLLTRLVEAEGSTGPAPLRHQAYYELWAPQAPAWGPETRVLTRPFVRSGLASWSGPADASFALRARRAGDRLSITVQVTDDHPMQGDRLQLFDRLGKEVPLRRGRGATGPQGEHQADLKALGLAEAEKRLLNDHGAAERALHDVLLACTFVLTDVDPGQAPTQLATSNHVGAPGLLRLGAAEAPAWDGPKARVQAWAQDDARFSGP